MQQVTRTLTSAEILALNVTGIELVAAPGAGRILIPIAVTGVLHFGGTAYAAGSDIHLYLGATDVGTGVSAAMVNAGADRGEENMCATASGSLALASFENLKLQAVAVGAAFTTGNGTLTLTLFYGTGKSS